MSAPAIKAFLPDPVIIMHLVELSSSARIIALFNSFIVVEFNELSCFSLLITVSYTHLTLPTSDLV